MFTDEIGEAMHPQPSPTRDARRGQRRDGPIDILVNNRSDQPRAMSQNSALTTGTAPATSILSGPWLDKVHGEARGAVSARDSNALRARFGSPDDVADVIALMVSDESRFITGETIRQRWRYMRP